MKGKWAAGIPPRNFTWIIKDHLAVSERPGGFGVNHRRVRRQEEIIWLRVQGFGRVISLLVSPHNLAAYDEEGLAWAHYPLERTGDPRPVLSSCYHDIDASLAAGLCILVHQDELGTGSWGWWPATWSGRTESPTSPRRWPWSSTSWATPWVGPAASCSPSSKACPPAASRRERPHRESVTSG